MTDVTQYEAGVIDALFEAWLAMPSYRLEACLKRAWAWRWATLDMPRQMHGDARRAAIYDEMTDAAERNDHAAVMAGFDRLSEVSQ